MIIKAEDQKPSPTMKTIARIDDTIPPIVKHVFTMSLASSPALGRKRIKAKSNPIVERRVSRYIAEITPEANPTASVE